MRKGMHDHLRRFIVISLGVVVFAVLPAIFLAKAQLQKDRLFSLFIENGSIFVFLLVAALFLSLWKRSLRTATSIVLGTYYLWVFAKCAYALFMKGNLSSGLMYNIMTEVPGQIIPTVARVLGPVQSFFVVLLLLIVWGAFISIWLLIIEHALPNRTHTLVVKTQRLLNDYFPIFIGLALFVIVPTFFVVPIGSPKAMVFEYFAQYFFIFTCVVCAGMCLTMLHSKRALLVSGILLANYYIGLLAWHFYNAYGANQHTVLSIMTFLKKIFTGLSGTSEILALSLAAVAILIPEIIVFQLWQVIIRRARTPHLTLITSLFLLSLFANRPLSRMQAILIPMVPTASTASPSGSGSTLSNGRDFYPYFPSFTTPKRLSGENFFILQMESENALAVEGFAEVDGKKYPGNFMPNIRKFTEKNGVFFPFFWSQGVHTTRGVESILCGVAGNVQGSLFYDLRRVQKPCLPELLAKKGYTPIFFGAFDDPNFDNALNFYKKIGFKEIHFSDIMNEGDRLYYWGYDDAIFYQRVFEYLHSRYPDPSKLFVYIQTSANHQGFDQKPEYKFLNAFEPPNALIEWYLNSFKAQDYGFKTFTKNYERYMPESTHLFILGDHSWPVGINGSTDWATGATSEHFLIHLSYIPPLSRASEFRVGEKIQQKFSQANIIETVFDLLSGEPQMESFASVMKFKEKQDPFYEDCQLLPQPENGPLLVVVKNQTEEYIYSFPDKTITYYDLKKDLLNMHPKILEEDVSLERFNNKYNCRKYWQNLRSSW